LDDQAVATANHVFGGAIQEEEPQPFVDDDGTDIEQVQSTGGESTRALPQ
jgi:hypothetical protein